LRALLDAGCEADAQDADQWTALHFAAFFGHYTLVRLLLEAGYSVEKRTKDGQTPLHVAARAKSVQVVSMLLAHGCDTETKTNDGLTSLHVAVYFGCDSNVVRTLIKGKADVNAKDTRGCTALSWAAFGGFDIALSLLLKAKANPNTKDNEGRTALHYAARKGFESCVAVLLEKGANPRIVSNNGVAALDIAMHAGHEHAYSRLRQAGASGQWSVQAPTDLEEDLPSTLEEEEDDPFENFGRQSDSTESTKSSNGWGSLPNPTMLTVPPPNFHGSKPNPKRGPDRSSSAPTAKMIDFSSLGVVGQLETEDAEDYEDAVTIVSVPGEESYYESDSSSSYLSGEMNVEQRQGSRAPRFELHKAGTAPQLEEVGTETKFDLTSSPLTSRSTAASLELDSP